MHLVMDRNALVEVVKDTAPMQIGGFIYPFHQFSMPQGRAPVKKLGHQRITRAAIAGGREAHGRGGLQTA